MSTFVDAQFLLYSNIFFYQWAIIICKIAKPMCSYKTFGWTPRSSDCASVSVCICVYLPRLSARKTSVLPSIALTDLYLQHRPSSETLKPRLSVPRVYLIQAFMRVECGKIGSRRWAHWLRARSDSTMSLVLPWECDRARRKYLGQPCELKRAGERTSASGKEKRRVIPERERERKRGRERMWVRKRWERSSRAEGKEEEGSPQKERGEQPIREDCRPMRHQAGDDVVVVSHRSLTKSLPRVPVRSRSPGWTRRSYLRPYRIAHRGRCVPFFFF